MRKVFVSPHDCSWLYDRCKRCWRRKIDGCRIGEDAMPGVFRAIDGGMKAGISIDLLRAHGIPAQEFIPKERVKSEPTICGSVEIVVSGYLDRLVLLEDETFAVVDYKTSAPKTDNFTRYWRQLSAYQFALEHPASGEPREVSRLDLIIFNPLGGRFKFDGDFRQAAQIGTIEHVPVELNRAKFAALIEEMARVAAAPELPAPGNWCEVCRALGVAQQMELQARTGEAA